MYIFGGILVLLILIMIVFPEARVLIKAPIRLFIKDRFSTPEGAAAAYDEVIEEEKDVLFESKENLQEIAGKLESAKRNLAQKSMELQAIDQKMENIAKDPAKADERKREELMLYAQDREARAAEKTIYENTVKQLEPLCEEAKKVFAFHDAEVKKLEREKVTVVNAIRLNQMTKDMYDSMDSIKKRTGSTKALEAAKEGALAKQEMAVGAKVVHDSKASTKLANIDAEVNATKTTQLVDDLLNKYKK